MADRRPRGSLRVRIAYVEDVDADFRRAVRRFYGLPGLATREELRDWFRAYGSSLNDDLASLPDEETGS